MIVTELEVYKKAHFMVLDIYKITAGFPKSEIYGLTSQMRRASLSINSNLIEGAAREGKYEFKHFASIARGSAAELQYQILVAKDLSLIDIITFDDLNTRIIEIIKMLSGLLKSNH